MVLNNPLLTEAIGVYFLYMDYLVEEQVIFNEDGSYSIFINSLPHCQVVNSDFMKLSSLSCDLSNINDIIGTVK